MLCPKSNKVEQSDPVGDGNENRTQQSQKRDREGDGDGFAHVLDGLAGSGIESVKENPARDGEEEAEAAENRSEQSLRLVLIRERVLGPDEVLAAAIEVLSWRSRIVTEGFASTQGRVLGVTVILIVWSSGLCLLRPKSKGPICLMESKF